MPYFLSTPDDLREYFEQFGKIADCYMPKNFQSGGSKGFGFISFEDGSSVQKVMKAAPHEIKGKTVTVDMADPKQNNRAPPRRFQPSFHRGMPMRPPPRRGVPMRPPPRPAMPMRRPDVWTAAAYGGTAPAYGGTAPAYGGTAPAYGGTAPAYGGTAPSYGGTAPSYGGTAPSYGGTAPSYGGTAPSYGGTAPSYGGTAPSYGGTAPSYGGTAPAYGGTAPSYGGTAPSYGGTAPSYGGTARSPRHGVNKDQSLKLFVGRLSYDTTADEMRAYFERFGSVADSFVPKNQSGRSRGFGFITFHSHESVANVRMQGEHCIDGRVVVIDPADPKAGDATPRPAQHAGATPSSAGGYASGPAYGTGVAEYSNAGPTRPFPSHSHGNRYVPY